MKYKKQKKQQQNHLHPMLNRERNLAQKKKNNSEDDIELTPDNKSLINWYPGHMAKALKQIKDKLKMVDLVIEIRDARAPLYTSNENLTEAIGNKMSLTVLNKADMCNAQTLEKWKKWFNANSIEFVCVMSLEKEDIKKIIDKAQSSYSNYWNKNHPGQAMRPKLKIMVTGLPNTGKSTLINRIADRKAARVADKPGHTVSQQWIKVGDQIELLDTPGIMPPKIKTEHQAFSLCSIHAIKEKIIDQGELAYFLMNSLLKTNSHLIASYYKLESLNAHSDPNELFSQIGTIRGCLLPKAAIDLPRVYKLFISDFRDGRFGTYSFEAPPR